MSELRAFFVRFLFVLLVLRLSRLGLRLFRLARLGLPRRLELRELVMLV